MKRIRIKALQMLNFCGVREASYEFGDELTTFSGKNGIGKSTVANAITYVLFGTDLKGNALDIKTYDADNKIIPEIPHEATLSMEVDGEEIILKRTLTDSWKGDSVKNTYKYFVNGENVPANDFKKTVDEICNEITFRMTSSATYFLSKPWMEQRMFLESLVPHTSTEEITGGDEKFDFVVKALEKENMEKLTKHLRYQRNEVQELLDKVPTRLFELNKVIPKKLDWESLKEEKAQMQEEYDRLQQDEAKINNGGADMVHKEGIRKRIEFDNKRIDNMKRSAMVAANDAKDKHMSDVFNATAARMAAISVVDELKRKMGGFTDTEVHVTEQIEECKKRVNAINVQKDSIEKLTWKWNDEDSFCPHCGQPLPMDKLEEIKSKSLENFNSSKAKGLKDLQDKFAKIKEEYKSCKLILENLEKDRVETTNQLKDAQQELKDAEKHLADVKSVVPKEYDELLGEKEEYQNVLKELKELQAELDKPSEGDAEAKELLESIGQRKTELKEKMESLDGLLKREETYIKVNKLIEEAQEDKKKFQEQLDGLDEKLSIANEYNQNSCKILEEQVNKLFHFVKWTMFKSNLDGVKVPYCECHHNGVPYSKLNSAAKVNAGIDIAYTISRYYNVSVPMILDECESNLHPIMRPDSQQIRFYVTQDETLKVDTPSLAVME